jgi:hypothetical protein
LANFLWLIRFAFRSYGAFFFFLVFSLLNFSTFLFLFVILFFLISDRRGFPVSIVPRVNKNPSLPSITRPSWHVLHDLAVVNYWLPEPIVSSVEYPSFVPTIELSPPSHVYYGLSSTSSLFIPSSTRSHLAVFCAGVALTVLPANVSLILSPVTPHRLLVWRRPLLCSTRMQVH